MKKHPFMNSVKWLAFIATPIACMLIVETAAAQTQNLAVRRHNSVSISNARVDQILADSTRLLRQNNGGGDVACSVTLRRNGSVRTTNVTDGTIDNESEFNRITSATPKVAVVRRINWCGGISPNIIGCANRGGPAKMTVVRINARYEGILWAHEFGHTQGLSHRNGGRLLMNPSLSGDENRVNRSECNVIRR